MMRRRHARVLFLTGTAMLSSWACLAAEDISPATAYLTFQVFTASPDPAIPAPAAGVLVLGGLPSKSDIDAMVQDILQAIGTTGDTQHKLGFMLGPLTFDHTEEQLQRLIQDGFDVALERDVAVGFHLDDSMYWGRREDLWGDRANVEWLDWDRTPNTGRRIDWSPTPTQFPPQMCLNSPAIRAAVQQRAGHIGQAISEGLSVLHEAGREELFAGVIAGWETQIGRDFATNRDLGYCAMTQAGFSAAHPPQDMDGERVRIVKEFIELWAQSLASAGVPAEKIYAHIAFTPQGFTDHEMASRPYSQVVNFALPEVAFSPFYHPGFSTYPSPGTFEAIHQELSARGNPGWASSEGTNVIPNGAPGEATMENYLGKIFNHGGILTNIFSWGIGGAALKETNFFRLATESDEALAAYRKFLTGGALSEEAPPGSFSATNLHAKIRTIQRDLPPWLERTRGHAKVEPLARALDAALKRNQFREADKIADALLQVLTQSHE